VKFFEYLTLLYFFAVLKCKNIISPSLPALFINFQSLAFIFSWTHSYSTWHVNVSGRKQTVVYIFLESPVGNHDFIRMVDCYMSYGLSF